MLISVIMIIAIVILGCYDLGLSPDYDLQLFPGYGLSHAAVF